jgi:hypothetical protein
MPRAGSIYGLLDETVVQGAAPQFVLHVECKRERRLYFALLLLASMNVFAGAAAASMFLLVRFGQYLLPQ